MGVYDLQKQRLSADIADWQNEQDRRLKRQLVGAGRRLGGGALTTGLNTVSKQAGKMYGRGLGDILTQEAQWGREEPFRTADYTGVLNGQNTLAGRGQNLNELLGKGRLDLANRGMAETEKTGALNRKWLPAQYTGYGPGGQETMQNRRLGSDLATADLMRKWYPSKFTGKGPDGESQTMDYMRMMLPYERMTPYQQAQMDLSNRQYSEMTPYQQALIEQAKNKNTADLWNTAGQVVGNSGFDLGSSLSDVANTAANIAAGPVGWVKQGADWLGDLTGWW